MPDCVYKRDSGFAWIGCTEARVFRFEKTSDHVPPSIDSYTVTVHDSAPDYIAVKRIYATFNSRQPQQQVTKEPFLSKETVYRKLEDINHQNIVKVYRVVHHAVDLDAANPRSPIDNMTGSLGGTFDVIMEWCEGETLSDYLKSVRPIQLTADAKHDVGRNIQRYCYQLLKGIHHLHLSDLVHGDIKGENAMVNTTNGLVKVIDLDNSHIKEKPYTFVVTTPGFTPPEFVTLNPNTICKPTADIWSYGRTLLQAVNGGYLDFSQPKEFIKLRLNAICDLKKLYDLAIDHCLKEDPESRRKAECVMKEFEKAQGTCPLCARCVADLVENNLSVLL